MRAVKSPQSSEGRVNECMGETAVSPNSFLYAWYRRISREHTL